MEQRLLFEKLSKNAADGKVQVKDMVAAVGEECKFNDKLPESQKRAIQLDDIKHNLVKQCREKRDESRLANDRHMVSGINCLIA